MSELKKTNNPDSQEVRQKFFNNFLGSRTFFKVEELRNRIFELETQLNRRNNEYVDLVQMDQADRAATLEAIRSKYGEAHDQATAEKDVRYVHIYL